MIEESSEVVASAEGESETDSYAPSFAIGPHRTVEQVVVAKLREAIITGSLRPGDRLTYRDLAQRFGVSVTPVRIALRELSNEGLVESRAHTGARVSPLSVDEIEEIFATRIGIEGWLARHGAPRLRDEAIAEMTEALEGLRDAERCEDLDAYLGHSWAMRATCYGAAEKPRLFDRFRVLYEHSSRYVFLMIADPGRLRRSRLDMEVFFEACRARDGLESQQAIQKALQTTLSYLSEAFDRSGSSGGDDEPSEPADAPGR
jgi:DNA-binding GntR family transcriptional regulator